MEEALRQAEPADPEDQPPVEVEWSVGPMKEYGPLVEVGLVTGDKWRGELVRSEHSFCLHKAERWLMGFQWRKVRWPVMIPKTAVAYWHKIDDREVR